MGNELRYSAVFAVMLDGLWVYWIAPGRVELTRAEAEELMREQFGQVSEVRALGVHTRHTPHFETQCRRNLRRAGIADRRSA